MPSAAHPPTSPPLLQMGATLFKCIWDQEAGAWGVERREELQGLERCSLSTATPALLLSPPPANALAQETQGVRAPSFTRPHTLAVAGIVPQCVCVYARACACLCVLGRACLPLVRSEALLARAAEPCSTCCAPGCVYLCA